MIKDDSGSHSIKAVSGGTLIVKKQRDMITLTDETEAADVKQSNGVIHVIDKVLMPKT